MNNIKFEALWWLYILQPKTLYLWCKDSQHEDNRHNDIQYKQHWAQRAFLQHSAEMTLSITTIYRMPLSSVSLCRVWLFICCYAECRVSFCLMSLCLAVVVPFLFWLFPFKEEISCCVCKFCVFAMFFSGAATFSIVTLSITTFSIMSFSITTHSIITLSIMTLSITISKM